MVIQGDPLCDGLNAKLHRRERLTAAAPIQHERCLGDPVDNAVDFEHPDDDRWLKTGRHHHAFLPDVSDQWRHGRFVSLGSLGRVAIFG